MAEEEKDFPTEMEEEKAKNERRERRLALKEEGGIDIHGLEGVPPSIIPIPFVRMVQPTSKNVTMVNGKEAPVGNFFFNDTQQCEEELTCAVIKAKHATVVYERDGVETPSQKLAILGFNLVSRKLFILSLSVMSFSNFGKLVAQLKDKDIENIWEYEIIISSEKQENEKGKYYVAKFKIGQKLGEEDLEILSQYYDRYGEVIEKRGEDDEVQD